MGGYENDFPLLAAHGLYASNIRGDGNCLFNALSDQIYGDQDRHLEIRANVVEHMRNHPGDFQPFIHVNPGGGTRRNPKRKTTAAAAPATYVPPTQADRDRQWEDYLTRMAASGSWGGHLELQAFADAYNIDLHIYQRDGQFRLTSQHPEPTQRIAHVAYHSWQHYSSIRNIDGPHTGQPNVQPRSLTPQEEAKQKEKLTTISPVQPWQINALLNSLPFLIDKQYARKVLEETKGDLNAACEKLLDSEDGGSASSAHENSSIERDPDSDDDFLDAPNKKQDRRLSRTSRPRPTYQRDSTRLSSLAPPSDSGSQESIESQSDAVSSTDASRIGMNDHPSLDGDTINVKTDDQTQPPKRLPRLKLNLSKPSTSGYKSAQKQMGPRRVSARDKKDMKKRAQKTARKERQQAAAGGLSRNMKTGMELRSQGMTNTPPIDKLSMKALYI